MSGAPGGNHTLAEVHLALGGFSAETLERFRRVARYQLLRFPQLDPQDLVSETAERFLDGRRAWPSGHPFEVVFYNALRSIADEFRSAEMGRVTIPVADLPQDADGAQPDIDDLAIDAREPEKAVSAAQLIERAFQHFSNDQDVEAVLYGRIEGQTAEEVQDTFAMSANDYHAARKRLERWTKDQGPLGKL